MALCADCRKKPKCTSPCQEMEKALEQNKTDEAFLVFFQEPKERLEEPEESYYVSRLPGKDAHLLSLRDAFRPLLGLNEQAVLVFIGRHYLGMSNKKLCETFKLKERRLYDILQRVKGVLAGVQSGQDVQKPGGDPGEDLGEQEDDMP